MIASATSAATSSAAQAVAAAAARDRAPAFAEARLQVHLRRVERGGEAEEDAREKSGDHREREDAGVDARRLQSRHSGGGGGHEHAAADLREGGSGECSEAAEEDALREELAHEAAAAGSEGRPHRELPLAGRPAPEQEVGHVGAGDEEDEGHRAQQHGQPLPVIAHHVVEEGRGGGPPIGVLERVVTHEVADDRVQVGAGLRGRDAGPEPSEEAQVVLVVHRAPLGGKGDGHPELLARRDEVEGFRHHADHLAGDARQPDLPSDHRRVRAEPAREEAVAEHDHAVVAGRVLLGGEEAAPRGRKPEERKVVVGHRRAEQPLGHVAVGEIERRVVDRGERRVRLLPFPDVQVVPRGGPAPRSAPRGRDAVETLRFGKGQRLEDDRAKDAVDRGGGPDTEGQREHRYRGESRRAARLPQGEGDVLPELSPPLAPTFPRVALARDLPALAARALEVRKTPLGGPPRRRGIHSRLHELARAHIKVELELVVHLALDGRAEEARESFEGHRGPGPQAGRSTRETAAENSAHAFVSRASWVRPSRVRR